MLDLILKTLPYLGGVVAILFYLLKKESAERKLNNYKSQAEEEIRSMSEKAAKAEAEAESNEKVKRVEASIPELEKVERKEISETSREEVLNIIDQMIKESKGK